MGDITYADLQRMQSAVTDTVRYEVGQARTEFREKFAELKDLHEAQDARVDRHEQAIARLDERLKLSARGLLVGLTKKQKAALWTIAGGAAGVVFDGIRHLAVMVFTIWAKGVRP